MDYIFSKINKIKIFSSFGKRNDRYNLGLETISYDLCVIIRMWVRRSKSQKQPRLLICVEPKRVSCLVGDGGPESCLPCRRPPPNQRKPANSVIIHSLILFPHISSKTHTFHIDLFNNYYIPLIINYY